jgi:hypothetical protein
MVAIQVARDTCRCSIASIPKCAAIQSNADSNAYADANLQDRLLESIDADRCKNGYCPVTIAITADLMLLVPRHGHIKDIQPRGREAFRIIISAVLEGIVYIAKVRKMV